MCLCEVGVSVGVDSVLVRGASLQQEPHTRRMWGIEKHTKTKVQKMINSQIQYLNTISDSKRQF